MTHRKKQTATSRVRICSLRKRDLGEVLDAYNRAYSALPAHSDLDIAGFRRRFLEPVQDMRFSFRYSAKAVLGKGRSGKIIGFSLARVTGPKRSRRVAAIRAFGILEEFRAQGIGKLMLKTQTQKLFREGFVSIKAPGIQNTNKPALKIMEHLGARTLGATTSWEKDLTQEIPEPTRPLGSGLMLTGVYDADPAQLYKDFSDFFSDTSVEMDLPSFLEAEWRNPASTMAIEQRHIVGMALVHSAEDPEYIAYVAVSKEHRNKGIGTHLVAEALRRMQKMGLTSARTVTADDNQAMTRIFQNLGFRLTGSTLHMVIRKEER